MRRRGRTRLILEPEVIKEVEEIAARVRGELCAMNAGLLLPKI